MNIPRLVVARNAISHASPFRASIFVPHIFYPWKVDVIAVICSRRNHLRKLCAQRASRRASRAALERFFSRVRGEKASMGQTGRISEIARCRLMAVSTTGRVIAAGLRQRRRQGWSCHRERNSSTTGGARTWTRRRVYVGAIDHVTRVPADGRTVAECAPPACSTRK